MSATVWSEAEAGSVNPGALAIRAPRQRTCLTGKLVYGNGTFKDNNFFTLDCCINNLSEGGAKITISQSRPLPGNVYLIILKYCVAHYAELAWMKYPSRGLRFCKTYSLGGSLPDEAKFLHNLWIDLYPRYSGIQHENR